MASVNKVILIGNLGRDPEVRYNPDGFAICNLALATTTVSRDRASGERREETEWHRVVLFGRQAEVAGEYLRKGRSVYIEGRLRTRKWQDKDGNERYTTEVVAEQMQMLGGRDSAGEGSADMGYGESRSYGDAPRAAAPSLAPAPASRGQSRNDQGHGAGEPGGLVDMDDDVPF